MITNDLQKRIYLGDRDAFLALYEEYGPGVYSIAFQQLCSEQLAKGVVKQTFLTLFEELLTETEDFDIPVRIRELADREVLLQRLVSGEHCSLPTDDATEPEFSSARSALSDDETTPVVLPSLERERAFRRPRKALFTRNTKKKTQKKRGLFLKLVILLLDLLLLWALVGVLMGLGYLPHIDLGYSWFFHSVLPLLLNQPLS